MIQEHDFSIFLKEISVVTFVPGLPFIKKGNRGAGEMAQCLRVLGALPEDKGSIPSTHM